jgi:DNA-binding NtrC family response regulator
MSEGVFAVVLNPGNDSGAQSGDAENHQTPAQPMTLRALRARAEVQGIREVLALTGWNRKQAARLLKVSYRGLLYKIRQHNITREPA